MKKKSPKPAAKTSAKQTNISGQGFIPPEYGVNFVDKQSNSNNAAVQGVFESSSEETFSVEPENEKAKAIRKKFLPNNTGLPDNLKTGIENLSGISMDEVRVHYNSSRPAQLKALAYTQGTEIHVAPGQERHLPHEAWHVVQQMQGRVQPTMQDQGASINDDATLESEADVLGAKALQTIRGEQVVTNQMSRSVSASALQRKINWNPEASAAYKQSAAGLLEKLQQEFFYVDSVVIENLINKIESYATSWSPSQAFNGIKDELRAKYAPPASNLDLSGTNITSEEAGWYFVSNFKTFMEAIVDNTHVFKFENTPDDNHAEDNMMQSLDKFITQRGWDEDFSQSHTLLIRINNSPCTRCAKNIYKWKNRDIFDELEIQFANMYEKNTGFTKATTLLRSGGITMTLFSVLGDLGSLITEDEQRKQRMSKDQQEAADWNKWRSSSSSSAAMAEGHN